jgi:hypothetical protein
MNEELFQVEPVLSPRLKWIQKHGVKIHYAGHLEEKELKYSAWLPYNDTGDKTEGLWSAVDAELVGYGDTEESALLHLMEIENLPHWN